MPETDTVSTSAAPSSGGESSGAGDIGTDPEIATGYRSGMQPVDEPSFAVSTANPVSTEAACDVLRDGGTAADALIAAQTVLGPLSG